MQVVRKHTNLSFPNHPSATSISNRQREVALSIDADSHKKGGPVIQYTSHCKKTKHPCRLNEAIVAGYTYSVQIFVSVSALTYFRTT